MANIQYMEFARPLHVAASLFALGVVLAAAVGGRPSTWWILLAACAGGAAWLHRCGAARACAVTIALAFLAAGGLRHRTADTAIDASLAPLAGREVALVGVVVRPPEVRGGVVRAVIRAESGEVGGYGRQLAGLALVERQGGLPLPWRYGDKVWVSGRLERPRGPRNPGDFDGRAYLQRQGIGYVLAGGGGPSGWRLLARGRGNPAMAVAHSLRGRLAAVMDATVPPQEAALLKGLVLGDRAGLSPDVTEDYRRAGLSHVLSVSGLHVGFVAGALLALARPLPLGPRGRAAVVLPALALYVLVTGAQAPVIRAAVMFGALVVARCLGRPGDGVQSLALAFLAILFGRPAALFEPGFQLSFGATLGIATLGPPLRDRLAGGRRPLCLPPWVAAGLGATLAAQLATLPLLLYYFGALSPVSLVANLAAVPLAGVAVPLGSAGAVAGLVWLPAGTLINRLTTLVLAVLDDIVHWFAAWPWASVDLPPPHPAGVALSYAGLVWLCRSPLAAALAGSPRPGWRQRVREPAITAAVVFATCFFLVWRPPAAGRWPVEAVFLDVGQGDGTVLHLPGGRTMVIDGGPPSRRPGGRTPVAAYLRYRGIRRVDVLVVTHGDADHIGGLRPVVEGFRLGEVWHGAGAGRDPAAARLLAAARAKGGRLRPLRRGDALVPAPGVRAMVLNPRDPPLAGTPADDNNGALVLRLAYGRATFLFTADLEWEGEGDVLRAGLPVAGEILKVGHHGSETSSRAAFLRAVAPRVAVIQVGRNAYGHPGRRVLSRLAAAGASVWRTDRSGAVTVRTDGRHVDVSGMTGRGHRQVVALPAPAGVK